MENNWMKRMKREKMQRCRRKVYTGRKEKEGTR